jgi:hypothetical protein
MKLKKEPAGEDGLQVDFPRMIWFTYYADGELYSHAARRMVWR